MAWPNKRKQLMREVAKERKRKRNLNIQEEHGWESSEVEGMLQLSSSYSKVQAQCQRCARRVLEAESDFRDQKEASHSVEHREEGPVWSVPAYQCGESDCVPQARNPGSGGCSVCKWGTGQRNTLR